MTARGHRAVGAIVLLSAVAAVAAIVIGLAGLARQADEPDAGKTQEAAPDPDYWLRRMCVQPRYQALDECADLRRRDASGEGGTEQAGQ